MSPHLLIFLLNFGRAALTTEEPARVEVCKHLATVIFQDLDAAPERRERARRYLHEGDRQCDRDFEKLYEQVELREMLNDVVSCFMSTQKAVDVDTCKKDTN
jgi:hypothetical protein